MTIHLDGRSLTAADVVAVARGSGAGAWPQVEVAPPARAALQRTRAYIEQHWLREDAPPIYGFNTGVGKLKDARIPLERIGHFQAMLINAHSAGLGEPLPEDAVRATLLLRANAFARGCSGPRLEVVERLLTMLNRGVHPLIPQAGSVGASGDLAPLAYLAGALTGHPQAEAVYQGQRLAAQAALAAAGIAPVEFPLEAKDGLAILNGSTVSLAIAVLAAHEARQALR
jgi:histidine ammonia-lyase